MRKLSVGTITLAMLILITGTAAAAGYAWKNHAPPFDFLFGNHIDTHQQSKVSSKGKLVGFFYIRFTGETTDDGIPFAMHANCSQVQDECTVGWKLHGLTMQATLLEKEMGEHPLWCIDPADLPQQPGYSHFHWFGTPEHAGNLVVGDKYDGMLLKLTAVDTFIFQHHGGFEVTPGIDTATHANIVAGCP